MVHSNEQLDQMTNTELVALARDRNHSAFNELMLRHRKQAFLWAHEYTNDPYLAEDIVQEALINAFMYLGSLEQMERFIPWLRKIITNQALMHLRRGGPYGKERPFSSLLQQNGEHDDETDSPIEVLLSRLARQRSEISDKQNDPASLWLRQETSEMLRSLLHCLKPKEREVFEAHFFKLYTPQEISSMTSTSSSNVYTLLSRSRRKIQQHQYQMNLTAYLQSRFTDPNQHSKAMLPLKNLYFGESWDTFALCVLHALQFSSSSYAPHSTYSMAEIMGLTGLAFRLQIHQPQLDLFEVNAFNWRRTFTKGLLNLGFAARSIGDGRLIPQTSEMLIEAFSFIHHSIGLGQPVIVWGVKMPFFALIHGYDDTQKLFYISGLFEQQTLDYNELGLNWSADLFVISLGNPYPVTPVEALRGALSMVIMHFEEHESPLHPGYVLGIRAYDAWINALSSDHIDPLSHAYQVWCVSSARHFACQFLELISERTQDYGEPVCTLASNAASFYRHAAEALYKLRGLYPFPSGGNHSDVSVREQGLAILEQVKEDEQNGLELLKNILKIL